MNRLQKIITPIFSLILLASAPMITLAADGDTIFSEAFPDLVVCGHDVDGDGVLNPTEECGLGDLFLLANNMVDFLIKIILIFSLFALLGVGAQYAFSGSSGQKNKAKENILKIVKGLALVLGAWIIVNTLLFAFGVKEDYNTFIEGGAPSADSD